MRLKGSEPIVAEKSGLVAEMLANLKVSNVRPAEAF
jgi:hypothetical protein